MVVGALRLDHHDSENTLSMHLLLPPSETKRSGGGAVFSADSLGHTAQLGGARALVRAALESVSRDEDAAAKALKLGVKNRDERLANLALDTSGAMPALDRYTGVLYDALGADSLEGDARAWVFQHVSIQSALFGLIGAGDEIPAYRLSAGSQLPSLELPLKKLWIEAHTGIDWRSLRGSAASNEPFILDLRSKDYAALAPMPTGLGTALHVAQRGEDGTVRALNHFNKAAKGDLVRRLALSRARIDDLGELLEWAADEGLDLSIGPGEGELTLITELGAPKTGVAAGRALTR